MGKKCEAPVCHRESKFTIRDIQSGKWLNVCGIHDNYYGIRNLIQQGESEKEARRINKEVKSFERD